ncbi:MAG: glycerol kinase GlpK [Solobacterium sp.]|nr:glycerol kinase GlpK [Solobacterium sp.]MBQ1447534.1 glycerol kinase GlpK [Solobacterium sp.]
MMEQYIMAIDQGTTSSRALLFDKENRVVASAQKEFTQIFPHPGWVEHDAMEIWLSVLGVMESCVRDAGIDVDRIAGIGITNQRETTVVWDRETGRPVYNAVVWQSRQTAGICDDLKAKGYNDLFVSKTGLMIDPYFAGTKIRWILDHIEDGQKKAEEGKLLAGTIDCWLIWCLSGGKVHATDCTNASRTLLYNIYERKWDEELCGILNIPMGMLPEVKDSSGIFAWTAPERVFGIHAPVCGAAGDQQAALFGQNCFTPGSVKNTYGTGCFLLMNTGEKPMRSGNGLVTTIAWGIDGKVNYALEGSVFVAGSALQWLRDQLSFFRKAADSEEMALSAQGSTVIMVPAFVGLGAPYWDDKCRGALFGLTRGTTTEDITKAALDSLAYQTKDVLSAMEQDTGSRITSLRVDGGASANNYLMRFQSDLLQCDVVRPANLETTAMGAAHLAGLAVGFWTMEDFARFADSDTLFTPSMSPEEAGKRYARWQNAVAAARMYQAED